MKHQQSEKIHLKRKCGPGIKTVLVTSLFTLMGAGLVTSAHAGIITSVPSATGAEGFGGWNLGNVNIIVNGTGSFFEPTTGAYYFDPDDSDFTYQGDVNDGAGTFMGIVLAKDWPVGEPSGIKVINDDELVKAPKPPNCIMATSYLADHFLDSDDPQQVLCSGPFQSHKRYKLAMLPASVDGIGNEGIDLVFNVEDDGGTRDYQIFQKINNWTDGRLEGFKIEVGFGLGAYFQNTSTAGVALQELNISVPSDIWSPTQLANFSAGLFGPLDSHTGSIGFFDPTTRAGFFIDEYVADGEQPLTDTLNATTTLGSDYAEVPPGASAGNQFGPWLPNNMLPYGVFFDDDGNPETDAELLAWYGYNPDLGVLGWMGGSQHPDGPFSAITDAEIMAMGENLAYSMDVIDDLVNVGPNYLVTVGDVTTFPASTFTIRVTPTKDTSGTPAPMFVGEDPDPLVIFASSDAQVLLDPNPTFVVDGLLTARVGDGDLNVDPAVAETVDITISSSTGLSGSLTLVELGENRGVFVATLPEEYSNVPVGTEVTMSYTDADAGLSGVDVIKTSTTTAIDELIVDLSDVDVDEFEAPETIRDGQSRNLKLVIINEEEAEAAASGSVLVTGTDGSLFTAEFSDLDIDKTAKFRFRWAASLDDPTESEVVIWSVSIIVNGEVVDFVENAGTTTIEPFKRGKDRDDEEDEDDEEDDEEEDEDEEDDD